jgi:diguanylate cyclase (GGDEF)-like protein
MKRQGHDADHVTMNRALVILSAGAIVGASYLVVAFGIAPETTAGPVAFASIAIPGIVTGLVMAGYIGWETRNARAAKLRNDELSAMLVRKEIEIGRLATVDELTGLYSRREFDEIVRVEYERFRRHQRPVALLLLEIDEIAELGEHVGSLGKGFLLAEVSAILKHALRTIDIGCRYTNDSLAMLLPDTDGAKAKVVAERVRAAAAEHEFLGQHEKGKLRLTVSQGIAVAGPGTSAHTNLLRAAERALYEARAAGFDQVKLVEASAGAEGGHAAA